MATYTMMTMMTMMMVMLMMMMMIHKYMNTYEDFNTYVPQFYFCSPLVPFMGTQSRAMFSEVSWNCRRTENWALPRRTPRPSGLNCHGFRSRCAAWRRSQGEHGGCGMRISWEYATQNGDTRTTA